MSKRGLYVDQWREGLRTREEADAMLLKAKELGITDLFIMVGTVDKGTILISQTQAINGFDPLQYIIDHKGIIKIHAWVSSIRLWRIQHKLDIHPNSWIMTDKIKYDEMGMVGGQYYLDPMIPDVQEHLVQKYADLVRNYRLDGLHVDKLRYPAYPIGLGTPEDKSIALTGLFNKIVAACKAINPRLEISAVVSSNPDHADYDFAREENWNADWLAYIVFTPDETVLDAKISEIGKRNAFVVASPMQIEKTKDFNQIIFSYWGIK